MFLSRKDIRIAAPLTPEVLPPERGRAQEHKQRIQGLLMRAAREASWLGDKIKQSAHVEFANANAAFDVIMGFQNRGIVPLENALKAAYEEYERWEEEEFQESERQPRQRL
jgi:hypothetical protein